MLPEGVVVVMVVAVLPGDVVAVVVVGAVLPEGVVVVLVAAVGVAAVVVVVVVLVVAAGAAVMVVVEVAAARVATVVGASASYLRGLGLPDCHHCFQWAEEEHAFSQVFPIDKGVAVVAIERLEALASAVLRSVRT